MKRIHIMPFTNVDGIRTFRDSEIEGFYNRIIKEGWEDVVFYDGTIRSGKHFCAIMKDGRSILHVVYYRGLPAALVWLNRFEQTHCYVHWTFFKCVSNFKAHKEIGEAVIKFMFDEYEIQLLMGITPSFNKLALRFLKSIGLKTYGEIPNILWNEKKGKAIPGQMMFINREDVK